MNQVPWRRILQRAANDEPGEGGAAIINLYDHAPDRMPPRHRTPPPIEDSVNLEGELQRALTRAQQKATHLRASSPQPQPHPDWGQPVFGSADQPNRVHSPRPRTAPIAARQRMLAVPTPTAQAAKSSGARNLMAISISLAVIGLAFHQISNQWEAAQTGPSAEQQEPGADQRTAASLAGISDPRAERLERASARIDLKPSLASEPAGQARQRGRTQSAALEQDIQDAARIFAQSEGRKKTAAAAIAGVAPTGSAAATEQAMLRRGREMMERGHIEGARLIFEHLAGQNSALGAFALAQTYDAHFISSNALSGVDLGRDSGGEVVSASRRTHHRVGVPIASRAAAASGSTPHFRAFRRPGRRQSGIPI